MCSSHSKQKKNEDFFPTLIKTMKKEELDEEQFFKITRMTNNQFWYLLHYLAEGCSVPKIAWGYRIGNATAHQIMKENCNVL
ncbi:hypothetical protein JTB14_030659 [Gonioctena quinquepunctata]|nr:hypothetical protein JTB14_030659 [Gonioctena quinquepunctata]